MDPQSTQNIPATLSLFKLQVSGKAPKFVTPDNLKILKCYIHSQYLFYSYFNKNIHINHQSYQLLKFLPKFYDKIEMNVKPDIEYKNDGVNKDIGVWL